MSTSMIEHEAAVSGEVVDESAAAPMTTEEARRLTDAAKQDVKALWRAMVELYEGGAHLALGYTSWQDYCATEFQVSPTTAQYLLDAGRVNRAIARYDNALTYTTDIPNARVAIELARLLPPVERAGDFGSSSRNKSGSDEKVAEAWRAVVAEHAKSEEPAKQITGSETRKVLVAKGYIADTRGTSGKPGWFELLGWAGDHLKLVKKDLDKVEAALAEAQQRKRPKYPNQKFVDKAHTYAEWADDVAARLRAIEGSDSEAA